MGVDPKKTRKVLVVHGVQTTDESKLDQDKLINDLLMSRIGNIPLSYACELYRYEGISDKAMKKYNHLVELLLQTPIGGAIAKETIDLVGDVVISLANGKTATAIRNGLREKILEIYASGNSCYIVAHSLGSIYAFDVLNELIGDNVLFQRDSRTTWPVQGLLTIGSPVGLKMFKKTGRNAVKNFGLGDKNKWFRWVNIWDANDPVVSGHIFGTKLSSYKVAEDFLTGQPEQGWVIHDIPVDTGKTWLLAHTAYWHSPVVGDKLFDMISA